MNDPLRGRNDLLVRATERALPSGPTLRCCQGTKDRCGALARTLLLFSDSPYSGIDSPEMRSAKVWRRRMRRGFWFWMRTSAARGLAL